MKLAQLVADNPKAWAEAWAEYEQQMADDFLATPEASVIALHHRLTAGRDFKQFVETDNHGQAGSGNGITQSGIGRKPFYGNKAKGG